MRTARTAGVLRAVHDRALEGVSTTTQSMRSLDQEAFARIVAFIDRKLLHSITIDDLAELADMSRHHFSRRFKLAAGMSPYAFITLRRMELAKKLLIETDLSHEQVAARVGFFHMGHFRRQFRKQFGVNPSDVRQIVVVVECGMAPAAE